MPSSPKILAANSRYRWIVLVILFLMVLLGLLFLQLTETYIEELKRLSQDAPQQALDKSAFLFVFVSMAAGVPAIGIGAYFLYQGYRIRVTQQCPLPDSRVIVDTPIIEGPRAIMRGHILMICGGFIIISGLALPIIAWRLTETF